LELKGRKSDGTSSGKDGFMVIGWRGYSTRNGANIVPNYEKTLAKRSLAILGNRAGVKSNANKPIF
jgi:hypothetical protein